MDSPVKLFKSDHLSHPVWILLGDINQGRALANQMIDQIKVHPNDVRVFEMSRDSLIDLSDFLALYAINLKIAVCVLQSWDEYIFSALLKRLEDVPKFVCIILIAKSIPDTIRNRGLLFNLDRSITKLPNLDLTLDELFENIDFESNPIVVIQSWFEKRLIKYMCSERSKIVASWYETWNKLVEVRVWWEAGNVADRVAIDMMRAIIIVSQFPIA